MCVLGMVEEFKDRGVAANDSHAQQFKQQQAKPGGYHENFLELLVHVDSD